MKIGLVCPYSITKRGGVREIVIATKDELVRRGHDVKIITPLPRGSEVKQLEDVIFIGVSTDFHSPTRTTTQFGATVDNDKIDEVLTSEQFDILHFHEPWIPVLSRQILQRSRSVNIATFHAVVPETLMSRTVVRVVTPYLKSVMKYLDVLTAVSEAGSEYARSLTDQPISIIPDGIDLNRFRPPSTIPARGKLKSILYIGRLEGRKGVKYLLHAYQLLLQVDPNVELIIAGDGPDREKLELLSEDLNLTHISFLGYVSDELKLELLTKADLFCAPSIYGESVGVVLLEAMAMGLVTIAGNNSGYAGLMQGVGAISIVNPRDAVEFARRLGVLLNEPELRRLWQKWALNYVKQFDYSNVVDQYESLYRKALKQHASTH